MAALLIAATGDRRFDGRGGGSLGFRLPYVLTHTAVDCNSKSRPHRDCDIAFYAVILRGVLQRGVERLWFVHMLVLGHCTTLPFIL
jgi:hypothetical protein